MAEEHRSLDQVRIPYAAPIVLLMSAAAGVTVLYLTRRFDFFYDEWDFVLGAPSWGVRDYFLPHNEHWSTIPALIYRALIAVNGLRSYMPFMAVLMVLHGFVAFLLFLVVRRRGGDLLGIAAAAAMLLMGRGYENIIWAFQIGFVGSVAYGLLAIWLIDSDDVPPWRAAIASLALLASLMSSGIGIPFCAAVGVRLLFDRTGRRRLWILVVPAAAYLIWFMAFGRGALKSHQSLLSVATLQPLTHYVPFGWGAAAAGLAGLGAEWAWLALVVVTIIVGCGWGRFGLRPLALGAAAALLLQYVIIGLVRAQLGDSEAAGTRYIYIASVFLLIILSDVGGHLRLLSAWTPAIVVATIAAVALNAVNLRTAIHDRNTVIFDSQRTELQTIWALRDAPGLNRKKVVDPAWTPNLPIGRYIDSRAREGSPLPDVSSSDLGTLPAGGVNEAMAQAFPFKLRGVLAAPAQGSCVAAVATTVTVTAPEGSHVVIKTPKAGHLSVVIWYAGSQPPPRPSSPHEADLIANEDVIVEMPRSGLGLTWHVQATTDDPADQPTICVSR